MSVIDLRTRCVVSDDLTDAQRVAAIIDDNARRIRMAATMIRAAGGLDLALRALHQAADDLRGRKI